MGKTKKVGMAGKFGCRYGSKTKEKWLRLKLQQKGEQKCPKCESKSKNMRGTIGVWNCPRCGCTFSGGAWAPKTDRGIASFRVTKRLQREL